MEQKPNTTKTGDLALVAFLSLREILPVDHSRDDLGHCLVYYEDSKELDDEMLKYQKTCSVCGFAASEFTRSFARARRLLFDGEIPRRK